MIRADFSGKQNDEVSTFQNKDNFFSKEKNYSGKEIEREKYLKNIETKKETKNQVEVSDEQSEELKIESIIEEPKKLVSEIIASNQELGKEDLDKMFLQAKYEEILINLKNFPKELHAEIFLKFANFGLEKELEKYFEDFVFDKENHFDIAIKTIRSGLGNLFVNKIDAFDGIKENEHEKIVFLLLENLDSRLSLIYNLHKFKISPTIHEKIFLQIFDSDKNFELSTKSLWKIKDKNIIASRHEVLNYSIKNLHIFSGIPKEKHIMLVNYCIDNGYYDQVFDNFEAFDIDTKDHIKIFDKVIERKANFSFLEYISKFEGITPSHHSYIMHKMIKQKSFYYLMKDIDYLTGLQKSDYKELEKVLLKEGRFQLLKENFYKLQLDEEYNFDEYSQTLKDIEYKRFWKQKREQRSFWGKLKREFKRTFWFLYEK